MVSRAKIKGLVPEFSLPTKATEGAAGYDFSYYGTRSVVLYPFNPLRDWVLDFLGLAPKPSQSTVSLGCQVELPKGHELQIRPRSGLAHKHGITILNSPGTIDSDYRGELKAIVINLGSKPFEITPGMRICQGVFSKNDAVEVEIAADELTNTARAANGFGSTGV